jgi:hypothetical protein
MTAGAGTPLGDPVAEGARIATVAAEKRVPLRVAGGVAVAMRCPSARSMPLKREYGDVDLATVGVARDEVSVLLASLGYSPDRELNILHGQRRLFFWDAANKRQLDVFVDEANLCHRIDLRGRLEVTPLTLSPADLLVLKLQVVETNEKDLIDICALAADHELTSDERGINHVYIAGLAARDWGLWRTMSMVAERARDFARQFPGLEVAPTVVERLERILAQLEAEPKSRGWRLRARVGERKRWYELPEEVGCEGEPEGRRATRFGPSSKPS